MRDKKIQLWISSFSLNVPNFDKSSNQTGETEFFLTSKTESVFDISQPVDDESFLLVGHCSKNDQLIKFPYNSLKSDSQSFELTSDP